jgi:tetratricopeptide (TPR) repeat protein
MMETACLNMIVQDQVNDLSIRKTLGLGYLTTQRLEEALDVYAGILCDYPEDEETYIILGDLYMSGQDYPMAEQFYRLALKYAANEADARQRLEIVWSKMGQPRSGSSSEREASPPEPIPTNPQAIARLLQRLTGRPTPISEDEIDRAANLLNEILHSSNPAEKVAESLDLIDSLLPALLELNIRQARSDGRPDLAAMLETLQANIDLQVSASRQGRGSKEAAEVRQEPVHTVPLALEQAALLLTNPTNPSARAVGIGDALMASGCQVSRGSSLPEDRPQVVIAMNPHLSAPLMECLALCATTRVPIIIDLDEDFEHLPIIHPGYPTCGLGHPARSRAYASALLLADAITVPSRILAANLCEAGYPAYFVPDGWSKKNPLWDKPVPHRSTLNIGWAGFPGLLEDVLPIRRVIA